MKSPTVLSAILAAMLSNTSDSKPAPKCPKCGKELVLVGPDTWVCSLQPDVCRVEIELEQEP
jgi:ssDNA-binding Zn-finger/Zn-ribbon topoisomerase 1